MSGTDGDRTRFRRRPVSAGALDPTVRTGASPVPGMLPEGLAWPPVLQPPGDGRPDADSLADWLRGARAEVRARLARDGALLVRGYGVHDASALAQCMRALQADVLAYAERSSPRTAVSAGVYTSTEHPRHQAIPLHNENAYQDTWPGLIAFCCEMPALRGGATPIADCRRIHARIPATVLQAFRERGIAYRRHFDGRLGLTWQQVFGTEDPAEVVRYCREHGLEHEWVGARGLTLRSHRRLVERHPGSGACVWFNHALFFNASSLGPEMRAALDGVPAAQWPFDTCYGDGTPLEPETLEVLRDAYDREAVRFEWQRGDLLLLDNMLVCHGREPFEGPRRVLVAMSDPIRLEDLRDPGH